MGLRLLGGPLATFAGAPQCWPRGATPWNPHGERPRWGPMLLEGGCSLVEHWLFGPGGCPGWLVRSAVLARALSTWNARSRGSRGPSTLLGPEGTAAGRLPLEDRTSPAIRGGGVRVPPAS